MVCRVYRKEGCFATGRFQSRPHNRHNYFKSDSRKGIFVALERPKTEMVEKHPRNLFMC